MRWIGFQRKVKDFKEILDLRKTNDFFAPPRASISGQSSSRNPRLVVFVCRCCALAHGLSTLDFEMFLVLYVGVVHLRMCLVLYICTQAKTKMF